MEKIKPYILPIVLIVLGYIIMVKASNEPTILDGQPDISMQWLALSKIVFIIGVIVALVKIFK